MHPEVYSGSASRAETEELRVNLPVIGGHGRRRVRERISGG
jgi:hypothetical protein